MKRPVIGLAGIVVGSTLAIPSTLISKTFSGAEAVGSNILIQAAQVMGLLILIGVPLLYWIILPLVERRQRKNNKINDI
ncbi:MAG: hypothetical protein MUP63_03035 [Candidatus Nanohaloarchaeota archaeon QJJ-7]|nr:hypothetical protein [Candidatus Nanohaloarchaeota archaeon QJJ-7]